MEVETIDFRHLPGASLTFDDLHQLLAEIDAALTDGVSGAIVMQGTDSIEEVAYYLDLHHDAPNPIVVTGAMRNPTLAGADGPANLLAAVLTAGALTARDRGVLVVMNDEIHTASRILKTHSTSTAAFQSPTTGPVGVLAEGTPRWLASPLPRHVITNPPPGPAAAAPSPTVLLHVATLDDDPRLLARTEDIIDGLVVAGMGVGHVRAELADTLERLAGRIPVVLASRTGRGPSLAATYGFPGSERDLLARGLISAGFLHPLKARVLLRSLLAIKASDHDISAAFAAASNTTDCSWPWPTHGES